MPSYRKTAEKIVISFSGHLDTVTCIGFEKKLYEKIVADNISVVFDLNDTLTISSMFLRICTKTAQTVGKEKFSVINTPEQPLKIFTLTKLIKFLNISPQKSNSGDQSQGKRPLKD